MTAQTQLMITKTRSNESGGIT